MLRTSSEATHRFSINGLVVDYSGANMDDFATGDPSAGDLVLVKGIYLRPGRGLRGDAEWNSGRTTG